MARMTSHNAASERFQITLEFERPVASVGYQNMSGTGPSISLRFDSHEEKPSTYGERKAKLRERTVSLVLDEADMTRILRRLVNPDYTMGFVMAGDFDRLNNDPAHRLCVRICEANGLFFSRYRYPLDKDFIPVLAVNARHALHQIERIIKRDVDASLLQRGEPEGEETRWLDAGGWLIGKE